MAHLWRASDAGDWEVFDLVAALYALRDGVAPSALAAVGDGDSLENLVVLRRGVDPHNEAWLLLAGEDGPVFVNGLLVHGGIAALTDRDEIRLADSPPIFFSTEQLARVVPFPSDVARGFCPRCKQAIASGSEAVKCPSCGLWHHASTSLPCWTYAEHCASCAQSTALDAGFQWTPEGL